MSKISNKFVTLGLRSDRNLSDLLEPKSALNGLLDNLVNDPDPNKTFVTEDLNAIRGIQNTNINAEKLSALSEITVKASSFSDGVVEISEVTPLVRIIDRIENIKIITGEIPAIRGGNGLLATFIPSSNINPGSTSSTGNTIFTIPPDPIREIFWDVGYFNLPSFIDPTFVDEYGGIQWEGYFTPSLRDPNVNITINSTGLVMFELDRADNGNYETLLNIYSAQRSINYTSALSGNTVFVIGSANTKFVSVNDIVDQENEIVVTEVGSDRITLSGSYTPQPPNTIIVKKELGSTSTSNTVRLPSLEIGTQVKIRLSFWFPNNGDEIREKYLELNYTSSNLPYSNLYTVKPSQQIGDLEIRKSLNEIVSPYQNNIGISGNNKNLYVNNSSLLTYSPSMNSLSQIRKSGPGNLTFSQNSNVISGSILNSSEIGNIIVPSDPASTINDIIKINDIISSSVMVVTANPNITGDVSFNILDHRGFITWFKSTSSGDTVTITNRNTNDLTVGMIVITSASSGYIRIKGVVNLTTFTTTTNLNLSGTQIIYIYSDRSLIDRSKDVFCNGVFGQVVSATANQGATTISLSSVIGVQVGQFIQFDGVIPTSTTVSSISGNNVTISNALLAQLPASSTVVFVPSVSGGTINREGCVIPLDTAPPFIGTDTGLRTNNRNIKSKSTVSNFTVEVDEFSATVNSIFVVKPVSVDAFFNKKFFIKSRLNNQLRNFSVLAVKKV